MDTLAVQTALAKLGYALTLDGKWGPQTRVAVQTFQRGKGLAADGIVGALTIKALQAATAEKPVAKPSVPSVPAGIVPVAWMPTARLERVICHWTAGNHKASNFDRGHYHILIEDDGKLIRGTPSIAANGIGGSGPRASHTLNCNTGSIGVSLCCMAGAVESPFNPGKAPITSVQWKTLAQVVAELCRHYGIPVTPKTVLSHAEVQANLGIKQRQKWDFTRLAFDPSAVGAKACGDMLRAAVAGLV